MQNSTVSLNIIKVLHIRSSFDPGGTESFLLHLFNFKQDKIQFFYALIKDGVYISRLSSANNKYFKLFRKRKIDFAILQEISKIIKKNNIDIIHTHQVFELIYAFLLKLTHPKIQIIHNVHLYNPDNNWEHFTEKFLINFVFKVICVSNSLKEALIAKGYPAKKLHLLYNPVKTPQLPAEYDEEMFKKKISYNPADLVTGMIGNFVNEKDQLTIIKAYNLLRKNYPQLKLIFIGKKTSNTKLCIDATPVEDLNRRVFFPGGIENASKYLKFFDLFVFSSLSETFGIAVFEALLMKVPVIASGIPVMKELSVNEKYFKLFNTGNAENLAEKIKWFMNKNNKNKIVQMTERAYLYASNNFSYERYIARLSEIYSEALN